MSGSKFPFAVTVEVKLSESEDFERMRGCGRYLLDDQLQSIWTLTEMDGNGVEPADFNNALPTLEILSSVGRVSGHDGCNRFFGKLTGNTSSLKFGMMGATMMACPDMELGNQFLKLISDQEFSYRLESGQLWLLQKDQVVVKFAKADAQLEIKELD